MLLIYVSLVPLKMLYYFFENFIRVLVIFTLPLPCPPRSTPICTQVCILFSFQGQFGKPKYSWMDSLPMEHSWFIRDYIHTKLTTANNCPYSLARGWTSFPRPVSMLGFGLVLVTSGCMHCCYRCFVLWGKSIKKHCGLLWLSYLPLYYW